MSLHSENTYSPMQLGPYEIIQDIAKNSIFYFCVSFRFPFITQFLSQLYDFYEILVTCVKIINVLQFSFGGYTIHF